MYQKTFVHSNEFREKYIYEGNVRFCVIIFEYLWQMVFPESNASLEKEIEILNEWFLWPCMRSLSLSFICIPFETIPVRIIEKLVIERKKSS